MRWRLGTGAISDSVTLAIISGVVAEIGSVRTFNPVNPCDIGPGPPLPVTSVPFSPVNANANALTAGPQPYYPMTCHQRLYKWPNTGVGPVRYYSEPSGWGVSLPPVEVAAGQTDWPLRPVTSVPIMQRDTEKPVWNETIVTTTELPQRGNSRREFWTFRPTIPWTPTVFIRNVQLEGDSRHCYIKGVTKDATGAALSGVTVRCLLSEYVARSYQLNPIVAEVVSDASGNYEFAVRAQLKYELVAYHESLNVGGISVDDLQADITVDIYCTTPGVAPAVGGGTVVVTNRIMVR